MKKSMKFLSLALALPLVASAAAAQATSGMLDLMQEQVDPSLSRADLLALASSTVSLRITQMVNPLVGVHAEWGNANSPSESS